MNRPEAQKTKRINVSLPVETLGMLDRVAPKGARSQVIDQAVHFYVNEIGKRNLREELKAGAIAHAERDLQLAEEFFYVDEENSVRE